MLAVGLGGAPEVLLCDEATGALDSNAGVVVLEALRRVNETLGTTTVVITHNAVIAAMADRVVRLSGGEITGIEEQASRRPARELSW